ncbi:MAG: hypothetical protein IPP59_09320 [Betaproteobacteria bacterium]|nr:hypothetical protein [Candidatus Dechloromonas phosphorivorans]
MFPWLDGVLILGYLLGGGFLLGSLLLIGPALPPVVKTRSPQLATRYLALTPLAAASVMSLGPLGTHRQPPESRTISGSAGCRTSASDCSVPACLRQAWLTFQLVLRSVGKIGQNRSPGWRCCGRLG